MDIKSKQNLITAICNGCERSFIAPENPFSLDNPELIAAKGDKLYAIYIPTYRETEDVDHLLRRLFLSQLCYGYKMTTVLLILEMSKALSHATNVLQNSFDHVSNNNNDILDYIKRDNLTKKRWKYFQETQSSQYLTYRVCLDLSEKMHRKNDLGNVALYKYKGEKIYYRSWAKDQEKVSNQISIVNNAFVGSICKKEKVVSFKTAFEQLMTSTFLSTYVLDNGVLYPTNMNGEMHLVNTDWAMFFDNMEPNAYNKMLSFIGLSPVLLISESDIDNAFYNYTKIRQDVLR